MKKLLPLFLLAFLASCQVKDTRLVGIWKIQEVSINGATMLHEDIGQPLIEFNDKGGYMLKMGNTIEKGGIKNPVEKGKYTIRDENFLKLEPNNAGKPSQELFIDSVAKDIVKYHSQTPQNRMDVLLVRVPYLESILSKEATEKKD